MKNIDYFKLQAKNLLKDYQTRYLSEDGDIYEYEPKFFDIVGIFLEYGIMDDDKNFEFKLGNAQHLIAQMAGFNGWKDLITSTEAEHQKLENFWKKVFIMNTDVQVLYRIILHLMVVK